MDAPLSPRVARPVMYQSWVRLTFVHWRYPPAAVRPLLPPGLDLETFDGSAWVGLIPFLMAGVRAPGVPALPWLSRFPETNVRTYVRDAHGRSGIWFFSLDAARLPAVLAARAGFGLPYYWSDMAVSTADRRISYRGRRRRVPALGPDQQGRASVDVAIGPALTPAERDERVHFLTARHRLFTTIGGRARGVAGDAPGSGVGGAAGRLATAEAEHAPWPLYRADLLSVDQDLLERARLPAPHGEPVAQASPGVRVRIGMWHRVAAHP